MHLELVSRLQLQQHSPSCQRLPQPVSFLCLFLHLLGCRLAYSYQRHDCNWRHSLLSVCFSVQDSRRALVQGALHCLVGVCQLGGVQFLTRRIQTEAWPILLHLMTHGVPEQTRAVYPSGALPAARLCLCCWLCCCCYAAHQCRHSCM